MKPISRLPFAPNELEKLIGERYIANLLKRYPLVDASSLLKQLSLHLPRFDRDVALNRECAREESVRLARRLLDLRQESHNRFPSSQSVYALRSLRFQAIPEKVAKSISESYHYLLSFRDRSAHFGLVGDGDDWPIAMASLSPCDLSNIVGPLGCENNGVQNGTALVLSRVFAFPGAPKNSISFLFGMTRRWIRKNRPEIQIIVTYVNPNLGFRATTYRADNWQFLGKEAGTRYCYLDGNYVTERYLWTIFGKSPDELLGSMPRLSKSRCTLEPLMVFIRPVSGQCAPLSEMTFERWSPGVLADGRNSDATNALHSRLRGLDSGILSGTGDHRPVRKFESIVPPGHFSTGNYGSSD